MAKKAARKKSAAVAPPKKTSRARGIRSLANDALDHLEELDEKYEIPKDSDVRKGVATVRACLHALLEGEGAVKALGKKIEDKITQVSEPRAEKMDDDEPTLFD